MDYGLIIGIAGRAGAGKDTVAEFLLDAFESSTDLYFQRYAFADPIKSALNVMFGWSIHNFTRKQKEKPQKTKGELEVSPRKAMQTLGTEWGRNCIDEDIWVKLLPLNKNLIVSDVRFHNEATFVKEKGFLVYVERPPNGLEVRNHASEEELNAAKELADSIILNNSSLEELQKQVNSISNKALRVAALRKAASTKPLQLKI